jgi:nitrite reductase/ring-hydroxylating ferredoxin subunit
MIAHDPDKRTSAPDGRPEDEQPAWRRDFPVDVPQDHYVARREFTKFMGLTSLGFVVGQFWILIQSWLRGQREPPPAKEIARTDDIAPGSFRTFHYPGDDDACLLLRLEDGSFVAYNQKCTHLTCAVVPEEGRLHCPCHNGNFECRTGRPMSGPPRRPLDRITLEVRDGILFATGVELRTV